ncbi:ATP synthase F1 subunit epsilon [Helicobacter winghamensis]|uniref:ATP synthase epsilon chain n=1 Tax=Helicobacter winghamensis TaxID=157268 RepID=A0A2N3PL22_9HELI|nr:ATP synthase F1 subunit epsilon [Helicobacter winghamensis]EEO26640.1 ATP synthase F1, epsilon subunit [Helicobacter winghamensis ATCC BAA-430]PKT79243.1 F0F1 ATP synthase subunit epsilon [Helicobacter winghamensis]PKT79311.1 F0F1 ATP synthase subunit epsilon [Helicobacter winghamensis]PKT79447.1 F0F1 ATP synthase subunit epsilon [Helicobacter winghamensis]PKT82402.1 F0F1 ATP synthase subunit epsilon [Helicobacter winghamensis]
METLKLDIVTPEGKIFSNSVKSVTLPGSEGEFGVLPGHVGIVTTLRPGVIEVEKVDGKKEIVAINWGHVKVDETSVDVLAEGAVDINGDSESEIAQAIANAKQLLEESTDNNMAVSMVVSHIENAAKNSL